MPTVKNIVLFSGRIGAAKDWARSELIQEHLANAQNVLAYVRIGVKHSMPTPAAPRPFRRFGVSCARRAAESTPCSAESKFP
jgi:hypothetical protein